MPELIRLPPANQPGLIGRFALVPYVVAVLLAVSDADGYVLALFHLRDGSNVPEQGAMDPVTQ